MKLFLKKSIAVAKTAAGIVLPLLLLSGCSSGTAMVQKAIDKGIDRIADYAAQSRNASVQENTSAADPAVQSDLASIDLEAFEPGQTFLVVNDNIPDLDVSDAANGSFEIYGELDALGRCTTAYANIGQDLMPTAKRESISSVKPTGWVNKPYDFVDGQYLYNRSHLIGFQLTAENANKQNLITGTRYFNAEGMLPFENMVADYIKETGNHVLYRVTPIFEGNDLVAKGVQMEALSVEDDGEGISFNVFIPNIQPGVSIDYATGENWADTQTYTADEETTTYILNTNSKKIHLPDCPNAQSISEKNRQQTTTVLSLLEAQGYEPCRTCLGS